MAERIPKIVVIGPSYVDMAVKCQAFPTPRHSVEGSSFSYNPTGEGVNRAVQAAFCGCDVTLISRVGDDCFGQLIKKNLAQFNVNSDLVYTANAMTTGTMITMVDPLGENSVCICAGANRTIGRDEIEYAVAEQVIAGCDACLVCGQLPQEAIVAAIRTAKIHKRRTMLDISLAVRNRDAAAHLNWPMEYYNVDILAIRFVDITCVNELGAGGTAELKAFCMELVAKGAACVVMSLGWRGALVADRRGCSHIPGMETEVVDNSCASDAFCGALAACCGTNDSPLDAVRFAVAAEAIARSRFGMQDALPKKEEIIVLLQRQPD